MPTFNNSIARSNAEALIPEAVSREIIQGAPTTSQVMRLARRLPDMTRSQQRMPVLSSLPTAYFVNGDTGLKPTTKMQWDNKYLNAEEIAVIVPIPEAVLMDADYDIWGEVRPRIIEAIGATFDAAVIHGTNAPDSWPDDLVTGATAAGHAVTLGTNADLFDDILSENGTMGKVEADGYNVTGHLAALTFKARLRGLRDANGNPIFMRTPQDRTRYELDGAPIEFTDNAAMNPAQALLINGDFNQLVYAIRQDVTYKLLTEAVIQDSAGNIILNLAQQDAVALRVVMRVAWQLPNPINRFNQTESTRYPFAVLKP